MKNEVNEIITKAANIINGAKTDSDVAIMLSRLPRRERRILQREIAKSKKKDGNK